MSSPYAERETLDQSVQPRDKQLLSKTCSIICRFIRSVASLINGDRLCIHTTCITEAILSMDCFLRGVYILRTSSSFHLPFIENPCSLIREIHASL